MLSSTPLPNKHQLGYRLFRGETLNAIVNAVNQAVVDSPIVTTNTTVGAATLTAAQMVSGVINRSGSTAAYTDTTDIGTAIDTALGNAAITGVSWMLQIVNNTAFVETLAGGTGVTLSGLSVIMPNSVGYFIITRTGVGAYNMVGINVDANDFVGAQAVVATADNGTTQTLTAAMISGGYQVYHTSTGGSTPSLTLPLGTAMDAALPNMQVGQSYTLRIINTNSGTATIVTNTGWTLTGTLTIAGGAAPAGAWTDFVITKTAAGTYTAVNVGTGTKT